MQVEQRILEFLDKNGVIDDDAVAYEHQEFPFTLEEFRAFYESLWRWNPEIDEPAEEELFETYHVPWSKNGKNYYLVHCFSMGGSSTLFTEEEFKNYKVRMKDLVEEIENKKKNR